MSCIVVVQVRESERVHDDGKECSMVWYGKGLGYRGEYIGMESKQKEIKECTKRELIADIYSKILS